MNENLLGSQIAKFRKANELTQEELGRSVGVSTQAVSRWECGGTPDVTLLPAIADRLHTTIDALFGREEGTPMDVEDTVYRWCMSLPKEQRLGRVTHLLWWLASHTALVSEASVSDFNLDYIPQCTIYNDDKKTLSLLRTYLVSEEGFLVGVGAKDLAFMSVFPEPAAGYAAYFAANNEYRALFSTLARPDCLELLLYLYGEKEHFYTAGTLAKRLHMDAQAVEEHLAALTGVHILNSYPLELENGIVNAYIICNNESLIPLLYFARILCQNDTYYINWCDRQSPLLRRGEEAKKEETAHENRKK